MNYEKAIEVNRAKLHGCTCPSCGNNFYRNIPSEGGVCGNCLREVSTENPVWIKLPCRDCNSSFVTIGRDDVICDNCVQAWHLMYPAVNTRFARKCTTPYQVTQQETIANYKTLEEAIKSATEWSKVYGYTVVQFRPDFCLCVMLIKFDKGQQISDVIIIPERWNDSGTILSIYTNQQDLENIDKWLREPESSNQ